MTDKFGAFASETEDCISCKDDMVYAKDVKLVIKPTSVTWTAMEMMKIQNIISENLNPDQIPDFSKEEITILETVNPTLAKFIFVKLIESGLNTSFING